MNPPHFIDGPDDLKQAIKTLVPKHLKGVDDIQVVVLDDPATAVKIGRKLGYDLKETQLIARSDGFWDQNTKTVYLNKGETVNNLYHELGHAVLDNADPEVRSQVNKFFRGDQEKYPVGMTIHEMGSLTEWVAGMFRLAYEDRGVESSRAVKFLKEYGLWALAPAIVMPKKDKKK